MSAIANMFEDLLQRVGRQNREAELCRKLRAHIHVLRVLKAENLPAWMAVKYHYICCKKCQAWATKEKMDRTVRELLLGEDA